MQRDDNGLYILLISVHGLIRAKEPELGRDADTGGQIKYVLEQARSLASQRQVSRIDLMTRRIDDVQVGADYKRTVESLGNGSQIIRLAAGPDDYLPKEQLWDHLDNLVDNALEYLHQQPRLPDIIHGHYADAGYVAAKLARILGIPLVYTGHSLGRVKTRRLLASGETMSDIEQRYQITRRIDAEEEALAIADLVIASSRNEIDQQYALYDYYDTATMRIIPPGTDLERFHPPQANEWRSAIWQSIKRFLDEPEKPFILALSRPDERKNITTLIKTYGESPALQELANLVIVAGNREQITAMDEGPQRVMTRLLLQIDAYDLYGKVAYPKHHDADDVPLLYRLAAHGRGVFINPALTEPFGLTLIEAAASGLPVVATEDGGPQDIIERCHNGLLVDPLNCKQINDALLSILRNSAQWQRLADQGLANVRKHYSWESHAAQYVEQIQPLCRQQRRALRSDYRPHSLPTPCYDRAIVTELDEALLGNPQALQRFNDTLRRHRKETAFAIASGRSLRSILRLIKSYNIPMPDALFTAMGTAIYYPPSLDPDVAWQHHIDHRWNGQAIHRLLDAMPGLTLQKASEQHHFKVSYIIDHELAPSADGIIRYLHQNDQCANVFTYQNQLLDILPVRASKGLALRYFCQQWEIPLQRVLVAGGTAAEEDMMRGNALGAVVSRLYDEEVKPLSQLDGIYFSRQLYADGILEALEHYDFFGHCAAPESRTDNGELT